MYTSLHDGVQYKITMDNLVQNNHRVLACWVMQRKDSQNGLGQLLLNLFSICNFLFIKGSFIYHIIPISQFVASHYFIIFYRYKGHFTAFLGVHFHIHILITMRTNRVQFHLDMLCMTCSEPSWCFAPLLRLPCIRLHLICKHDRDDDGVSQHPQYKKTSIPLTSWFIDIDLETGSRMRNYQDLPY